MATYSAVQEAVRRLAKEKSNFREATIKRLKISKGEYIDTKRDGKTSSDKASPKKDPV